MTPLRTRVRHLWQAISDRPENVKARDKRITRIALETLEPRLLFTAVEYVSISWQEAGQARNDSINPGGSVSIEADPGTLVARVHADDQTTAPPYEYFYTDFNNGKSDTVNWNFPYSPFWSGDDFGPLDTQIWFGVNTNLGRVEVFVDWIEPLGGPDLVVSNVAIDGATSSSGAVYEVGDEVDVSGIVWNFGDTASASSSVGYYLTTSNNESLLTSGNRINSDGTSALAPGSGDADSDAYTFEPGDEGTRWFAMVADYRDDVAESDEGNNVTWWGPFTVDAGNQPPTISSLSATPDTIDRGDNFILTASGVSDPDAGDSVDRVEFYFDADNDGTLDAAEQTPIQLDTSASGGWTASIDTSSFSAGTYRYFARAYDGEAWSTAVSADLTIEDPALFAPTFLGMLSEFANASLGAIDGDFETFYQQGAKYLGYVSGTVAGWGDLGLSVDVYFDLADYYSSYNAEATFSNEGHVGDWVTIWVDVSVGLGASILPAEIGVMPIGMVDAEDPDRAWDLSFISGTLPIINTTAFSFSDQGFDWGNSSLAFTSNVGFSVVELSANVLRFEIQRDTLDQQIANAVGSNPATFAGTQILDLADSILPTLIDVSGLVPKPNSTLSLSDIRQFTKQDDTAVEVDGVLNAVFGGYDVDDDGIPDNQFPILPDLFGVPYVGVPMEVTFQNVGNQEADYFIEVSGVPSGWFVGAVDGEGGIAPIIDRKIDIEDVEVHVNGNDWESTLWAVAATDSAPSTADVTFTLYHDRTFPATNVFLDAKTVTLQVYEPPVANNSPNLTLISPASDDTYDTTQSLLIEWLDADTDDNAYISLALDPDLTPTPWSDTDHQWITVGLREDIDGACDDYLLDLAGVAPGTYTVWGVIYDGVNTEVYSRAPGTVTVLPELEPEIQVSYGAGTPVEDEQSSVVNYGSAIQDSGDIAKTFVIENIGDAELTLGQIELLDNNGFTVTLQPDPILSPGASTTFRIFMLDGEIGTKSADVRFTNNDSDENPFDFSIGGIVDPIPLEPEIELTGNGLPISDGDSSPDLADGTDFGSHNIGATSIIQTFVVENTGSEILDLNGSPSIQISGSPAFSVASQPIESAIAPGGSASFEIAFDPTNDAGDTATVTIANNDSDENPYTFVVSGVGTVPAGDDHGDDAGSATSLVPNGPAVAGVMEVPSDADWFSFPAMAGSGYSLFTTVDHEQDTVLRLVDTDGVTVLDVNDDDLDRCCYFHSKIEWVAPADGTYYLEVTPLNSDGTGLGDYTIQVTETTPVLPTNPLAYYDFADTLVDRTGNGYNGVVTGSEVLGEGVAGAGLYLDGSSYVSLGDSFDNLNEMSAAFWVKADAGTIGNNAQRLFTKHLTTVQGGTPGKSFSLIVLPQNHATNPGQFNLRVYSNDGFYDVTGGPAMEADQWYHVAMTHEAGEMRLYVDGQLIGATSQKLNTSSSPIAGDVVMQDTTTQTRIGASEGTSDRFQGRFDEFYVYDRVISHADVAAMFQSAQPNVIEDAFDTLDTDRWDVVSGAWSAGAGVLTGDWSQSQAQTDQGNLLFKPFQAGDSYQFEVEVLDDNGGVALYNSPGNKYNVILNVSQERVIIQYRLEGARYQAEVDLFLNDIGYGDLIQPGQPARLGVIASGDRYFITVNGTQVYSFTDSIWNGQNRVGLRAYGTAQYERAWGQLIDAIQTDVAPDANPWLAGMPNGTPDFPGSGDPTPDLAPAQSPVPVPGLPMVPGLALSFTASGTVRVSGNAGVSGADGNPNNVTFHGSSPQYGIANVNIPANALVGVFLEDGQPDQFTAPSALDFTSVSSRDYTQLAPEVRQPFFIGDGLRSTGQAQQIIVPEGATRLFLGTMDGSDWQDNTGGYSVGVSVAGTVVYVSGDTNGDGDIDDADIGNALSNFTGPIGAAGGKTAAQADTNGDGDVDDADLGTLISGFTGPSNPAQLTDIPGRQGLSEESGTGVEMSRDQQFAAWMLFDQQQAGSSSPGSGFGLFELDDHADEETNTTGVYDALSHRILQES